MRELKALGVQTARTFEQLLELDIDAVWLPLPIDLHRPFTETALAAGKAVMCEKPAAGSVDDVDAMIAARIARGCRCSSVFRTSINPRSQRSSSGYSAASSENRFPRR